LRDETRDIAIKALESAKSGHNRIDSMEEPLRVMARVAMSVEQLADRMDAILEELRGHDSRICTLERLPGMTAIQAWRFVVCLLATAIGSAVLTKFFL
jgi:hypothetical protein